MLRTKYVQGEVVALLERFKATDHRLEQRTAGEVVALMRRDGPTVAPRRAQDPPRQGETTRQAGILDSLPAHIALLDAQGMVVTVNHAWRRFAQANNFASANAGVGANYLEICDRARGDDAVEAKQVAAGLRAVLGRKVNSFAIEYPCHSPTEKRWFELTAAALAGDRVDGAVLVHANITERVLAKQQIEDLSQKTQRREHLLNTALSSIDGIVECEARSTRDVSARRQSADASRANESEQRQLAIQLEHERSKLVAAQRVAKIGSWETDLTTMELTWSDETHRIHGTDPRTFQPTHERFLGLVHPEDRARVDNAFIASLDNRSPCTIEHRVLLANGRIKCVEENWQVSFDSRLRPILAAGTCQDITERRQAETALRDSEAQFRSLAEAMPQIVWIARADGWNTYVSHQWADYTGLPIESSLGHGWSDALHPDDKQRADDDWQRPLAAGSAYLFEGRLRRADGIYRWWLIRGVPIRDAAGNVAQWFGTCTDVHDMKLAELEISRANQALRESEIRVKYMNRVYAMLSGINTLIVRVGDTGELFREACRIAIEEGGFRMAMIAIVDPATGQIVPRAHSGKDDELMAAIRHRLSGPQAGETMTGQAVSGRKVVVSNDSLADPKVVFGQKYADSGVHSMIILPLLVRDEAVGVFALYASEVDFFHEDELKLLRELAADVAFAIDHIEKQERLNYLAYYDELTGLANRNLFHGRVEQFMRSAQSGGHKLALCVIDLERFKNFNGALGRQAGDSLLRHVAGLLTSNAGEAILVGRLGGDHFAVVLPELSREEDVAHHIENLLREFQENPFRLDDSSYQVVARVGIALFPGDGIDTDSLFNNAEAALKKAKSTSNRYLFYTQKMTETVAGRLTLENNLRQALGEKQFVLHYQPKVDLATGKVIGAEALIRWNDPRTGLVAPGQFIPILEETGLIREVGRWAMRQAMQDYLRWRASGLSALPIAVNVSALQLRHHDFIADVEWAIGIEPGASAGLELEITESMIMEDVAQSIETLRAIRKRGVRIAIDDFGTGFSSLGYLAKLPIDTLKIDRSFVSEMTASQGGLALVSTIINLAHSLKLNVVAEGVETSEQSRLLRLLNCDQMQGFLFSKPVPVDVFEASFLGAAEAVLS